MAALRVSRALLRVAAAEPAIVVPRALPVATPFIRHPNWEKGVELSTTWQTDVTQSEQHLSEERRGLVTKPLRRIRADLLGTTKEESFAITAAAMRLGHHPCPVPLYCDFTTLESDIEAYEGNWLLRCDTTYRRFYYGQRIAIVKPEHDNDPTLSGSYLFCTIVLVFPNALVVTGLAAAPPVSSIIYPLMDAEVTLNTNAELITDSIADINIDALESSSIGTLPPVWLGSLNSLFYYAMHDKESYQEPYDGRGLLVFDVAPNWKNGINTKMVRKGIRTPLGTGGQMQVRGDRPLFEHTLDIEAHTRKEAWLPLRLFDGLKGRQIPFWFPLESSPWEILDIGANAVKVKVAGSLYDVWNYFQFIIIDFPNTDIKIKLVRQIEEVVAQATYGEYIINFSPSILVLPVHLARVRPVDKVRMEQDTITEHWITDSVMATKLKMVSLLSEESRPVEFIAKEPYIHGLAETIPDLTLWLNAAKNIYSGESGIFYRAGSVPKKHSDLHVWFDVREVIPEVWNGGRYFELPLKRMVDLSQTGAPGHINTPRDRDRNNHSPTIVNPRFEYLPFYAEFNPYLGMTNEEKSLWGPDGWTIIVAMTGGETYTASTEYSGGSKYGIRIRDTQGNVLFNWLWFRTSSVQQSQAIVEVRATPEDVIPYFLHHASPTFFMPIIMVFRLQTITQGKGMQVYMNGSGGVPGSPWLMTAAQGAPPGIAMPNFGHTFARTPLLTALQFGLPKASAYSSGSFEYFWDRRPFLNSILSFKRAITNIEMNAVAQMLVQQFGGIWIDV